MNSGSYINIDKSIAEQKVIEIINIIKSSSSDIIQSLINHASEMILKHRLFNLDTALKSAISHRISLTHYKNENSIEFNYDISIINNHYAKNASFVEMISSKNHSRIIGT